MVAEVTQPFGTDYDTTPIEVARPAKDVYDGPWSHNKFAECAEQYYRGAMSRLISIGPGCTNIRMRDNTLLVESTEFELEVADESGGW